MTEFTVTMQRAPELSEAEKRRRISRAYDVILRAGRRARRSETADDDEPVEDTSATANAELAGESNEEVDIRDG